MEKILVIDDDRAIQKALRHLFEPEGYTVEVASDGAAGLAAFRVLRPNFVLLDLQLPVVHGRDVCRQIRTEFPLTPIIVLTAAADEADRVLLLELGADDYVTKPFSPKELLARVRTVQRRCSVSRTTVAPCRFDDTLVDFAKMELSRNGTPISLTPQEFKVLKYFFQNKERVISREEFLHAVWGYSCYPFTRTVDAHVLSLRHKLEKNPANPKHFVTVHNAGYKFVP
jgi:DNA-binding response OmpR family regulator